MRWTRAWPEPLGKWIPTATLDNLLDEKRTTASGRGLLSGNRALASLIPALLDRGDPVGRKVAFAMAMADGSPPMLETLRQFAFGQRGPDSMRHKALMELHRREAIDAGPHRFFSRGKWTDVQLFAPEIYFEAAGEVEPWESELARIGTEAMNRGDYDAAERAWEDTLAHNPDSRTAAFNLAVVWMHRDGRAGRRRAEVRFRELHEQYPDYLFASIALANLAAEDGDFDRAGELLATVVNRKRFHVSEAAALFSAQLNRIARGELAAAEQAHAMLVEICGTNHPVATEIRERIEAANNKRSLRGLLSLLGSD